MADPDVELGGRYERQGQADLAEAAYRRADNRGDATGALLLGVLLKRKGDLTGAEAAYRRSGDRGNAAALCNLAVLLEARGDITAAETAYRHADTMDFPGGAYGLGQLLYDRGDLQGAIAANRRADQLGDADAAFNLGILLKQTGDLAGAESAFQRSGDRGHAPAISAYARLLEQRDDLATALAAYRRADKAGDPDGSYGLGVLLHAKGQMADSMAAFSRAAAFGHLGAPQVLQILETQILYRPGDPRSAPALTDTAGHAFLSYAREDSAKADHLEQTLQAAGIPVWRDTTVLLPGDSWEQTITRAITMNALVFLACFSRNSLARKARFQNLELNLAIDQLRRRLPGEPWLIPVRFDNCDIPDLDIGGGRALTSIHRADIYGENAESEMGKLITAVRRILASSRK